nr:citrate lyase holo-[acyl-carrier protein] synthase [Tepidanaerobacter acetatoxydans]
MDIELLKVLEAREQRWNTRKKLVEKRNGCIITITLCVPIIFRKDEEFYMLFLQLCKKFFRALISGGYQVCFEGCMRSMMALLSSYLLRPMLKRLKEFAWSLKSLL